MSIDDKLLQERVRRALVGSKNKIEVIDKFLGVLGEIADEARAACGDSIESENYIDGVVVKYQDAVEKTNLSYRGIYTENKKAIIKADQQYRVSIPGSLWAVSKHRQNQPFEFYSYFKNIDGIEYLALFDEPLRGETVPRVRKLDKGKRFTIPSGSARKENFPRGTPLVVAGLGDHIGIFRKDVYESNRSIIDKNAID